MSVGQFLTAYFISILIFILIDGFWLGKVAPKMYKKYIGHLMADKPNFNPAGLFYLIYLFGLVYLAVMPAFNETSWSNALLSGLIYGVACYATFDLTSQAVFKKWPSKITVIDLIWGGFLTTTVSLGTYILLIKIY